MRDALPDVVPDVALPDIVMVGVAATTVLAVWSSAPDARFTRRLREAGFEADEVKIRANGTRGARHIIWMASVRETLPRSQQG